MINDDHPLMVVPYGQPKTGGSPMSQAGSRPRDAWLAPSCRQYTFSSRHAQVPEGIEQTHRKGLGGCSKSILNSTDLEKEGDQR